MSELSSTDLTSHEVRARLRAVLPRSAFAPQPWRGVLAIVIAVAYCALGLAVMALDLGWPWKLLAGLAIGQGIAASSLIGHEILHGAVFRSKRWQDLVGGLVFAPYGFSAAFWRAWHVQIHHGHTNEPGADPDCMGYHATLDDDRVVAAFARALPGGRSVLAKLSGFVAFTGNAMLILWYRGGMLGTSRRRVAWMRVSCVLLVAGQIGLGAAMGGQNALFLLVVPQLVANAVLMSYISTQHWLDPLSETNDAIRITSSVATWKVFDYMHGWFSFHQEHHVFPGMSPVFARQVREKLREIVPERLSVLPHWAALRWVYRTPRTYGRTDELLDETRSFTVRDIKRALAAR